MLRYGHQPAHKTALALPLRAARPVEFTRAKGKGRCSSSFRFSRAQRPGESLEGDRAAFSAIESITHAHAYTIFSLSFSFRSPHFEYCATLMISTDETQFGRSVKRRLWCLYIYF